MERLEIAEEFDYIAVAAKVVNPKPHPEIFEVCANALHVQPENCIGFEDAQAGIESIHAAKMMSVGIGVSVTSVSPDLPLKSTKELDFDSVISKYITYSKQNTQ